MPKNFLVVKENQVVTAQVGKKTTLINSCSANLYLTDSDTDASMAELPFEAKQAVLNALYRLKPGESKSLSAGTYNLAFDYGYNLSAVIISE